MVEGARGPYDAAVVLVTHVSRAFEAVSSSVGVLREWLSGRVTRWERSTAQAQGQGQMASLDAGAPTQGLGLGLDRGDLLRFQVLLNNLEHLESCLDFRAVA